MSLNASDPLFLKQNPVSADVVHAEPLYADAIASAPCNPSYQPDVAFPSGIGGAMGINEDGCRSHLAEYGWPKGLQDTFIANLQKIPLRFFICDDSGSMMANDGHRLMSSGGTDRFVPCSRWDELASALRFHATTAVAACAPTEFRFLNGAQPIKLGVQDDAEEGRYQALLALLNQSPSGGTPLCRHIHEVIQQIEPMAPELRAQGQKAVIVIATDGESSDGDIANAMRPLRSLPVWVVIRLCTDVERVVDYWNNIDTQLEMDMDVLDDLAGEAQEVYTVNPWLTYGEPLHRLREFGVLIKEMDLMDTTKLNLDQIRKFCTIIYGGTMDSYPHPELDPTAFVKAVEVANKTTAKVWNPVTRKHQDWINKAKLKKLAHKTNCTIS